MNAENKDQKNFSYSMDFFQKFKTHCNISEVFQLRQSFFLVVFPVKDTH